MRIAIINRFSRGIHHRLHSLAVRRQRLALFALTSLHALPLAKLSFRQHCDKQECRPFAAALAQRTDRFRAAKKWDPNALFGDTAAITNLKSFDDFEPYRKAVSKITDGKYPRSANKARRLGYYVQRVGIGSHLRSHFDIRASKLLRSQGMMLEAVGSLKPPDEDSFVLPVESVCLEHWRADFGLFSREDDRMWGFASLVRAGNVVQLDHMICHADVLWAGGMKLLQFDIMKWFLDRNDPAIQNLDYVLHGAIEDGGEGSAAWRRYVLQNPHLIRRARLEEIQLPEDFDPQIYLELNPDVRAARQSPGKHYLRYGIIEGRSYKLDR